jgi:two-component system chemotaxis response regulator CheB
LKKIKVLVIDDSAVIRSLLSDILSTDKEIEVVGVAMDPYAARAKIKKLLPDVLTLDIEMPKMDGISFLKNIMRLRPMPVVMISSLTEAGAEIALEALQIGAVDYIAKPKLDDARKLHEYAEEIIAKVKSASRVRVFPGGATAAGSDLASRPAAYKYIHRPEHPTNSEMVIAIGASTGGTEAIKEILVRMRPNAPAVLITQHIPKLFSTAFAKRMDDVSSMSVCEAEDGQRIRQGHVYIAPGDQHLKLRREGQDYFCQLDNSAPVNRHMPSVDVLFESVANCVGPGAVGIILTGMGRDGALGLRAMLESGAETIAQDENTSVVWGMPGEAVRLNAAKNVLPLGKIVDTLDTLIKSRLETTR